MSAQGINDVIWVEIDYVCEEMAGGFETTLQITLTTPSGYNGIPPLTINIFIPGDNSTIPAGAEDHFVGRLNEQEVFIDLKNTVENLFLSCSQGSPAGYIFDGLMEIRAALYELKEEIEPFSKQAQSESLFGMNIYYDEGNPDLEAPERFNGDISWTEWNIAGERTIKAYGFQYDEMDRLSQAINKERKPDCNDNIENSGPYDVTGITYDGRGNIKGLKRRGMHKVYQGYINEDIDDLTYSYESGSNMLNSVTENSPSFWANEEGLKGTASYQFDGNGRTTSISYANAGTKTFGPYTYMDLPQKISQGNHYVKNHYTANGVKTVSTRNVYKNGSWTEEVTTYLGNIELKDGAFYALNHAEGRLMKDEFGNMHEEYFIKDHLGNVRVRFEDIDKDGNIHYELPVEDEYEESELIASHQYYPFGMEWKGHFYYDDYKEIQRKRYNGKEFAEGLGLSDYGARWYDQVVGRCDVVDPMAEKMPSWSPYNYTFNNPIRLTDPDGMEPYDIIVNDQVWTPGTEDEFGHKVFAALNHLHKNIEAGDISVQEKPGNVIMDFVGENAIGDIDIISAEYSGYGNRTYASENGKNIFFDPELGIHVGPGKNGENVEGDVSPASL